MNFLQTTNHYVIAHSDSGQITGQLYAPVTSYVSIISLRDLSVDTE